MFKASNYVKPTNKRWKYWSKFLTRSLPLYLGILAGIPEQYINVEIKIWGGVILSFAVATISSLSEYTTDEQN